MVSDQQLVVNNLEEKLKAFTKAVNGELINEEGFVLANTGVPTDTFNTLVSRNPNIKNARRIRQGIDSFYEKEYPFSVWIDAGQKNDDWTSLMQTYGLKEAERNVMMKLNHTLDIGQRLSHHLTITEVKNNEELSQYIEVFTSLFEGTPEQDALKSYFNKFSQAKLGPDVQMFIGCLDEMVVTTGLLIEGKSSYGVYDVMTKETARGKGYGSEMFQFLLNQTKDKQKPVVLQASEDGKNIYKRFGFLDVGEMVVFE